MMRRILIHGLAFVLLGCLTTAAIAGNSTNHTVTVTVNTINEVAVVGGNLTLTISTATAGSNPNNATDSATCDLNWTTNDADKKITVATNLAVQKFTLKVVAQNVSGGTAAAEVTITDTAASLVTAISTTLGTCDLSYTALATAAQGTGSDAHTVTYTLIDE
jgi:hypothetical protein